MALTNEETLTWNDALYNKYVRPLEAEHWGKFVAVAPDGRIMLGTNPYKIDIEAWNAFGDEAVMFEVGDRESVKPAPIPRSNAKNALSPRTSYPIIKLYEQYGKPLEDKHQGKFVAIASDGRTLLGADKDILFNEALKVLGNDILIFELGRPGRKE
ncbi:MAG: hypothetical protein F4X34_06845 [Chloroflexi bacterium]|nr:hypothetical protein [Chloroflexota bacterium]